MAKKRHHKKRPEKNTCCLNYAWISEVIANYGADTFWLANLVDTLTYWSLSPIEILGISTGVSIPALTIGSVLALLSSLGYSSARKAVNLHMSDDPSDDEEDGSEISYGSIKEEEASDLEQGKLIDADEKQKKASDGLSWWQYLKLAGHLVSSAGDIAAMPVALFTLVSLKTSPPKVAKFLVQCGATLWGTTAAIPATKSCASAMRNLNKKSAA